jgi:hypothetical protein
MNPSQHDPSRLQRVPALVTQRHAGSRDPGPRHFRASPAVLRTLRVPSFPDGPDDAHDHRGGSGEGTPEPRQHAAQTVRSTLLHMMFPVLFPCLAAPQPRQAEEVPDSGAV